MDRLRLEYATEVFLSSMRMQFAALNGVEENPIKGLREYPEKQRSALMTAISKAVLAADPVGDQSFAKWCERRAENDK